MADKRILVTGAAGFIGSHLSNRLSRDNYVIGLDDYSNRCDAEINFECIEGDVRNEQLVDEMIRGADVVYHLAAQVNIEMSWEKPNLTFSVNVAGTKNVLEACKKHRKEMVFASTCEVYGTTNSDSIRESQPLDPKSPYARSKAEAERLCMEYVNNGAKVLILRSFNTYGPFQHGAVIPNFVRSISNGESPRIFGDGTQRRDFMLIDDALRAYEIMSGSGLYGEPVNFGTGRATSIDSLARLIIRLLGSDLKPVYADPRPREVSFKADITRARGLGFGPETDLENGLRGYIDWFRNPKAYKI